MDYPSNDEELDKLLKLLESTEELVHNHPFRTFLEANKIAPGSELIDGLHLIKLYRRYSGKKLCIRKAIEVCNGFLEVQYIKAIPYFKINKKIRGVSRRKKRAKTKKA